MMRTLGKTVLTVVCVSVGTLLFAGAADAQAQINLKLAHVVPPDSTKDKANKRFAELVKQYTNGAVAIDVFPGGQLGNERDLAQGVLLGTIDIFWGDAGVFSSHVKEMNVFNTPFLFRDLAHWKSVVRGPIMDELVSELEQKTGTAIVGRMQMGERYILTRNKRVETPADLKGLKIRVPDVPMYTSSFKALGATATPIAFNEVYISLQQGVIDGMENPDGLIRGMKFFEVTKYLTRPGWSNAVNILVINGNAWKRLSPQQQEVARKAGEEASLYLDVLMAEEVADNLSYFKQQGMTIVDIPDMGPWLAQVSDFPQEFGQLWGTPGLYGKIQGYGR
jgi:tripartite ATP-independent transporter DctP family solute receptor